MSETEIEAEIERIKRLTSALEGLFAEIEAEQELVQTSLDDYDATPAWRWIRQTNLLKIATSHHKRAGELLAAAQNLLTYRGDSNDA